MDDAFAALGLPDTATIDQVKQAYRKQAELLHPDKGGSTEGFAKLHVAYKMALLLAQRPLQCEPCGGTGFTELVNGWRVTRIICADCGGSGTIQRGG
jgi:DnaJ-class molecular chaperone